LSKYCIPCATPCCLSALVAEEILNPSATDRDCSLLIFSTDAAGHTALDIATAALPVHTRLASYLRDVEGRFSHLRGTNLRGTEAARDDNSHFAPGSARRHNAGSTPVPPGLYVTIVLYIGAVYSSAPASAISD
jgi:hypothetical protein